MPEILSQTHLNVHYSVQEYERQSHIKYHGVELYKCVIPCIPDKAIYGDKEGNCDMMKVRDAFVDFLFLEGGKTSVNLFVEWKTNKYDLTGNQNLRTLDMCVVNECVGDILEQYCLPDDCDHNKVFDYLKRAK